VPNDLDETIAQLGSLAEVEPNDIDQKLLDQHIGRCHNYLLIQAQKRTVLSLHSDFKNKLLLFGVCAR